VSKFNKILFSIAVTLWFLIAVVRISNHFDRQRERAAYERGAMQMVAVHLCLHHYASQAFKDKMWNMVNMPEDCRYIEAVDKQLDEEACKINPAFCTTARPADPSRAPEEMK